VAIEIRVLNEDDSPASYRAFETAMQLGPLTDEAIEMRRPGWYADRSVGAFDGGLLVGNATALPCETLLPGGAWVLSSAVSRVGVLSTHRRRGALTDLMHRQLQDAFDRGEVLASLRASEAVIYGRFGYGVAAHGVEVEISTARSAFRSDVATTGRFRYVRGPEVLDVVPEIYRRSLQRPGAITRWETYWPRVFSGLVTAESTDAWWLVVHEDDRGRPDGYIDWEALDRNSWTTKGNRIQVGDVMATSAAVEAQLWRFVLDLDLVQTVVSENRPPDDPLRWLLIDQRAYKTTNIWDEQWIRLLDVPGVLGARSYASDDTVVVEVTHDSVFEHNVGRFEVSGAGCRKVRRAPDIRLDITTLGAVSMGGTSFAELTMSGRVDEVRKGAVVRADRLFACRPLPWSGTFF
jgi:predicted acetyltransferase